MFVNINFFNSYSPLGRPATHHHHTSTPIATHIDHHNRRPAASRSLLLPYKECRVVIPWCRAISFDAATLNHINLRWCTMLVSFRGL